MSLLNVRIVPEVLQKYVLAKVMENDRVLLWGNPSVDWHKEIVSEIEAAGHKVTQVYGGGKIQLCTPTKTIYVWGKSSVFGESPFVKVREILNEEYLDFLIVNEEPPANHNL